MGDSISFTDSLIKIKSNLKSDLNKLTEEYEAMKLSLDDNVFSHLHPLKQIELLKRQQEMEDEFYQLKDKIQKIEEQLKNVKQ